MTLGVTLGVGVFVAVFVGVGVKAFEQSVHAVNELGIVLSVNVTLWS